MIHMTKNSQVAYKYKFGGGDIKKTLGEGEGERRGRRERRLKKKLFMHRPWV